METKGTDQPFSRMNILDQLQHRVLHEAWKNQHLVLFLGAGVSRDYGAPTWDTLVLEMLFEYVADGSPLRDLAINYRRAVSDWLADYFAYEPTVLARLVEDFVLGGSILRGAPIDNSARQRFLEAVRAKLYDSVVHPQGRTTLQAVADIVTKVKGNVPAIVNFNFDDLLEQELKHRGFSYVSVASPGRAPHGPVPIIHAHGCLPQNEPIPEGGIIFTERDYHALTEGVFHWALTEIVWNLRHRTVLFVGLSMSDPNLRRLLDAACSAGPAPHYLIQRKHEVPDNEQLSVLQHLQHAAGVWRQKYGRGLDKPSRDLFGVLKHTLEQVDQFDTQLFEKMGVNTIWIDEFAHIPALLDEISVPR
jgi:hypothetical protein